MNTVQRRDLLTNARDAVRLVVTIQIATTYGIRGTIACRLPLTDGAVPRRSRYHAAMSRTPAHARFVAATGATVIAMLALLAPSRASACSSIRDDDRRALCRARESRSTSDCSSIRDSDLRSYCRGVVGGSSSDCSSIRDDDLRNQCRAESGSGSSSDCSSIGDADRRALCRARAGGSTSECSSISDGDLRHYCRGVVARSSSDCSSIRSDDLRSQCRSEAEGR